MQSTKDLCNEGPNPLDLLVLFIDAARQYERTRENYPIRPKAEGKARRRASIGAPLGERIRVRREASDVQIHALKALPFQRMLHRLQQRVGMSSLCDLASKQSLGMNEFFSVVQALVVCGPYFLIFDDTQKTFLCCVVVQNYIGYVRQNFVQNLLTEWLCEWCPRGGAHSGNGT